MTPHQLAKNHCANYQPNGSCRGCNLSEDGAIRSLTPRPKCLLALDSIKRCAYFESCVMPYRYDNSNARIESSVRSDWNEATHAYRMATGCLTESPIRLCPQCLKYKIEKGRRFCEACKTQNRLRTFEDSNRVRK